MNKGITILILVVLLGAMGLVLYSHTRPEDNAATVAQSDASASRQQSPGGASLPVGAVPPSSDDSSPPATSPRNSPQPRENGLARIEPPLSSSPSEGTRAPVTVTMGNTGEAPRVVSPPQQPSPPAGSKTDEASPRSGAGEAQTNAPAKTDPAATGAKSDKPDTPEAKAEAKPAEPDKKAATEAKPTDPEKTAAKTAGSEKTPALSEKAAHTMKKIGLHFAGQRIVLRMEADTAFPCKTFALGSPDRLVVDLPGTWKGMQTPGVPQNLVVKGVRVGKQPAGPRIVLDLEKPLQKHEVVRQGNVVEVYLQ